MAQATLERRVRVIPASRPQGGADTHSRRKRVAAYCRVSTDSEEQLNSYEAQKVYYTRKIEENPDWEMAGIFADKGISGTSLKKREKFNQMIEACKHGRIDLIITKSLSRFARNTVDCLETVRMLKAIGIGVLFEKENINTLTESSEFLITLFSGFAQAESESLSKNISWGIHKSMEAGNVTLQYKSMLGYRKGADGKPEIVRSEAEIVRRIYRLYLDGLSLGDIKARLDTDRVPTAKGVRTWSSQVIRNILTNEKYIGDALLQKTYITDCISKQVKKNRGERPMYYVENHHEAIVSKELFNRVREEMTRRTSKRKVLQKTGKTEQGKYSAKYALTELLVCGECGTPYKRVTWARNGRKRVVWRCISRLEFGVRYCHNSPSMDEEKLHTAILAALNGYAALKDEVDGTVLDFVKIAKSGREGDGASLLALRNRLVDLTAKQKLLLDKVLENMDDPDLNAQLKALAEEKQGLLERIAALQQDEVQQANQVSRMTELEKFLKSGDVRFKEYDNIITRKFVEKITVLDAETILVRLRDGIELEAKLC